MQRHRWAEFLPFSIPERTPYSDEAYAVLGRALTYLCEFENQCTSLSGFIGEGKNRGQVPDDELRRELLDFVEKNDLKEYLDQITHDLEDENDLKKTFEKARNSRDRLLRDLSLDKKEELDNRDERKQFIEQIGDAVRDIAVADAIINSVSLLLTKETEFFPRREYLNEYPDKIVKWVVNA